MEGKEAFEYKLLCYYRGAHVDVRRVYYQVLLEDGSSAVTDGFNRDTEELNARIFPTINAVEQSSSHACLVQVRRK